ncbi:MAG: ATP-binding protein [Bacteroidales bacterium]|nr:ATP-binding protein [Bacteroidales bacterium]
MSYKIAIASGKGGTGKTTVSVNLFHILSTEEKKTVHLVDCDVEEPNDLIFFTNAGKVKVNEIFQMIPEIHKGKCTFCRKCVEYCEFNAIVVIPAAKFAEVNASLCHSCGACLIACQENAIREIPKPIGKVSVYDVKAGNKLIEGKLKIGSAMQTMLIRELKKRVPGEQDIILYDAPPGTSCPVVETVCDADYVILVSEPTPFGLHDLKIMTELLKEMHKPYGLIINKAGLGNEEIYRFIELENIELLGEIPFKRDYAACYARGNLFNNIPKEIRNSYIQIIEKLGRRVSVYERNNCIKR